VDNVRPAWRAELLRVGFFTYGMTGERMTGIARYAVELTRALREAEPSLDIVLINPYPESEHPWYREFETYPVPQLRTLPFAATAGNWALHRAALNLGLDVLHDPTGIAPFLIPTTTYQRLVTIHDAIPYVYPGTQPIATHIVFRTLLRLARYTASGVITVSKASAIDIEKYLRIPSEKIHVTSLGMAPPPPLSETTGQCLERLQIQTPYFLYVGALHPRKNIKRVIEAFVTLRQQNESLHLVIVGPPSWGADDILREVLQSTQDGGIKFTGFVSDEELDALYREAIALVFPSLYEGFGLPPLEAMARGTPVITSNVSSLPEVVGDAALLVDPTSTAAIHTAMERVLKDHQLRQDLSMRGLERALHFSWENTAKHTLALYHQLL